MQANFNTEHYIKVTEARKKAGLPTDNSNILIESNLVGKKFRSVQTNEEYVVQSVHRLWQHGWYEVLLLVDEAGSHAMAVWKLFNCNNDCVKSCYEKSQQYWEMIDETKRI
jgi:hypothetical protein